MSKRFAGPYSRLESVMAEPTLRARVRRGLLKVEQLHARHPPSTTASGGGPAPAWSTTG